MVMFYLLLVISSKFLDSHTLPSPINVYVTNGL